MNQNAVASDNNELKDVNSHFAFGKNWADYSQLIDQQRIREARKGLIKLLGEDLIRGKTFLDIGCGSGLHSLAALQLGAKRLLAVDIDRDSVETTRKVLAQHAPGAEVQVANVSVFDLSPERLGQFDIVYSWGVLHHTGAMFEAIERASSMVAPQGLLAIALYRKTLLCPFWRAEKRWYTKAPPAAQKAVQTVYKTLVRAAFAATGRDYKGYVNNYSARGMSYDHDVHDWLGGFPYESILAPEVDALMSRLGFEDLRSFTGKMPVGLFGSGCDQYVYRKL